MAKEIGRLDGCVKQGTLTRGAIVGDARHHEVTQVVSLEVQSVGKSPLLVFRSDLCTDDGLVAVFAVCIDTLVSLFDDDRCVDVSIGTLCLHHLFDELIHQGIQFGVFVDGIDGSHSLQPFIHVAVVEGRSPVFALTRSGSDFEITEAVRDVRIAPGCPHALQGSVAIDIESFPPEASGPLHGTEGCVNHFRILTVRHISQSACL